MALLRNLQFPPALLLLDEVTSALDAENKAQVKTLIQQMARQHGMSVLWISHDAQETADGARVISPIKYGGGAMNHPAIDNTSLALACLLVLVALFVSQKEKLGLHKDILWSVTRAVVQLTLVGYVLHYLFDFNNRWLTLLMVLFICVNAALNARKRSKRIGNAFWISLAAIGVGTGLTLTILVLSGAIAFVPMQVIPISGMIAGNAMVAVGLCFTQLNQRFADNRQK